MAKLKKYVTLNNGIQMPTLGFGVFQMDNPQECEQAVVDALQAGYRLIDTASGYLNEEAVGRAIKRSGIPRKEIFVVTKLWIQDASEEKAGLALDRALDRLQLDYLDLYLIHQPMGDYYGAWRALEKAYKVGKVRAIGVSNFSNGRIQDLIMHHKITPAVNQIQINPFHPAQNQVDWLANKNIHTMAWGPFAEGKCGIFTNPILTEIARKHGKTVGQIILAWEVSNGSTVIPKSVHKERIIENMDFYDIQLTCDEIKQISSLETSESLFGDVESPELIEFLVNNIFNI